MLIVLQISTHPRRWTAHARAGTRAGHPGRGGDDPDEYLVRRARDGYLDAYAELTDRHGPLAYRVALRLLGNRQEAEEVTREALVAAWRDLSGFREDSSYPTWLLRIVTGRTLLRITAPRPAESLGQLGQAVSGSAGPARKAGRGAAADAVAAAVAALPPPQRVAIVLHHFEGFSSDEVARITGSTVPAVRRQLGHGRRALARSLRKDRRLAGPLRRERYGGW
jgi:RNA polymerase sigma-70 factor (ECF subfamily)